MPKEFDYLSTIRVITQQGVAVQNAEIDGLILAPLTLVSIKAKKNSQNPARDYEMWKTIVTVLGEEGTLIVDGEPKKLSIDLAKKPDWCGLNFDDTADGKKVWGHRSSSASRSTSKKSSLT